MYFVLSVLGTRGVTAPSAPESKANVMNRVVAKMVDLSIVFALAAIVWYPFGPLLGFIYSLIADGFSFGPFSGQSIGKKIMKLRVMNLALNRPARIRDSVYRNAPVGVATFFAIIPIWGWIILALIGLPLMLMEIYLMASVEMGHRLGDVMGETQVVEIEPERPDGGSASAFEKA